MKKILAAVLILGAFALHCNAAIYYNYYTTNAAPAVGGATNGIQISGGVGTNTTLYDLTVASTLAAWPGNITGGGSNNSFTNFSLRIFNPSDSTGIKASRLGSGLYWSTLDDKPLFGMTPSGITGHTNVIAGSGAQFIGNGAGLTNLNGGSIQAGTINSNKLDAATVAMFGTGGSGTTYSNITESGYSDYWTNASVGAVNSTWISGDKYAQTNGSAYVVVTNGTIVSSGGITLGGNVTQVAGVGRIISGGSVSVVGGMVNLYAGGNGIAQLRNNSDVRMLETRMDMTYAAGFQATNTITATNGFSANSTAFLIPPSTNGTAGQALLSAGNSNTYWGTVAASGGATNDALPWVLDNDSNYTNAVGQKITAGAFPTSEFKLGVNDYIVNGAYWRSLLGIEFGDDETYYIHGDGTFNLGAGTFSSLNTDTFTAGTAQFTNAFFTNATFINPFNASMATNLPGWINVLDYGASTAIANNSPAIQAAIHAATNNTSGLRGGTVYIPAGNYRCTDTITTYIGVTLRGDGREATMLNFGTAALVDCITFSTNGMTSSGSLDDASVIIKDLYVWNNYGARTNTGSAINLTAPEGTGLFIAPVVQNVWARVASKYGISVTGIGGMIDNCKISYTTVAAYNVSSPTTYFTIKNSYASANYGLGYWIADASYSSLLSCASDNNLLGGYHVTNGVGVSLLSCGAEQNGVNQFKWTDTQDSTMQSCTSWQRLTSSNNAVYLDGVDGLSINQCYLGGQPNATNSGYAVYIDPAGTSIGVELVGYNMDSYGLGVVNDTSKLAVYRTGSTNVFSTFITNAAALATDADGKIVAGSGGTAYTNNSTGLPGVIVGNGIGTNLSTLATLTVMASADTVVSNGLSVRLINTNSALVTRISDSTNAANLTPIIVAQLARTTNTYAGSNYLGGVFNFTTNSGAAVAPNMAVEYSLLATNAAFAALPPTGIDLTKTRVQTHVMMITNSTASAVAITAPAAPVVAKGTWYVTNVSSITTTVYPNVITNMICLPLR